MVRPHARALLLCGGALLFGCSLLVSTSELDSGAGGGVTPDASNEISSANDGPISPPGDSDAPIADGGSPVSEGGCPSSGPLFCDDFDEVTSPSSQWKRSAPVKDGGFELDLTTFVSAPHSIVFHAPPVNFEPTAALSGTLTGAQTKRTRVSFDVKVDQHSPAGAIFAIGPNPYPNNVTFYFISLRVDDNQFTYNAGIQLNDGGLDNLYQRLGGNPGAWTHFDVDYDVNIARIDVRMDGALKVTDSFQAVPAEGLSFDIGLVELQNSPDPWLIHFDNFSVSAL